MKASKSNKEGGGARVSVKSSMARIAELERENADLRASAAHRASEASSAQELRSEIDVTRLSFRERQEIVDRIFIWSPHLRAIANDLSECADTFGLKNPKSAFVYGPSNSGKTSLLEHYTAQAFPIETEEGRLQPILSVMIPPNATPKGVATEILSRLGDPHAQRGTVPTLLERVSTLMKGCQVRLLVLDEFQHLVSRGGDRVYADAADWLKSLIVKTRVPVLAFGMEEHGLAVFNLEEQIGRRFPVRHMLQVFKADAPDGMRDLRAFLYQYDLKLPLAERSDLALPHIARAFGEASGGVIGYVVDILREAMYNALRDHRERIVLSDLAHGFEHAIGAIDPRRDNPFMGVAATA